MCAIALTGTSAGFVWYMSGIFVTLECSVYDCYDMSAVYQ